MVITTAIICLTIILIVNIICFTSYKMRNVKHTDEFLRDLKSRIRTIDRTLDWISNDTSNIRTFMSKYESNLNKENKNE